MSTLESESLLQNLIGDCTYAEGFEDDVYIEAVEEQGGKEDEIQYAACNIKNLKSDDWDDVAVDIPKGEEVAVLRKQSNWMCIQFQAPDGWTEGNNIQKTGPLV